MGALIVLGVLILASFAGLAMWRGRLVSIALAGSECPDCRVPLVSVPSDSSTTWRIQACPSCDRVVTVVANLPSPVAECPTCHGPSLAVYAERVEGSIVVDEWCDLCGRRKRITLDPGDRTSGNEPDSKGRVLPFRRH